MSDTGLRNWVFTSYVVPPVVPSENKHFRYCVYQIEKCPDTGRPHAQGYIEFTRTMRMKAIKVLFNNNALHLAPRQGSREQARHYSMCPGSHCLCGNEWRDKKIIIEPPVEFGTWEVQPGKRIDLAAARETILKKRKRDELYQDPELDQIMTKYPRWAERVLDTKPVEHKVEIELFDWQIQVGELLCADPQHRQIIWIWSTQSNTGKSTFREYCATKYDLLPARGKLADIIYGYDNEQIIWFDYTRAQSGYESYDALEELSNHGYKFSTKFQSKKKFIKAHVVVTSNHPPDESRLPQRFLVFNVDPQI